MSELHPAKDTHAKALAINLEASIYGSFAEIGAGQEVARWFLTVGAASGTVAQTISAYDKAVSDDTYGAGRAMSRAGDARPRIQAGDRASGAGARHADALLRVRRHRRHAQLQGRQRAARVGRAALPDTARGRSQRRAAPRQPDGPDRPAATGSPRGARGESIVRGTPRARLRRRVPRVSVRCAVDRPAGDRRPGAEWPGLRRTGPARVVPRVGAQADGPGHRVRPRLPRRRALERAAQTPAHHRPRTLRHAGTISCRHAARRRPVLRAEPIDLRREPLGIVEIALHPVLDDDAPDNGTLLARIESALGLAPTLVTDLPEAYQLAPYLRRYTTEPLRLVGGVSMLAYILQSQLYDELAGSLLEGMGKLFASNVKFYAYPMPRAAVTEALGSGPSRVRIPDSKSPVVGADDLFSNRPCITSTATCVKRDGSCRSRRLRGDDDYVAHLRSGNIAFRKNADRFCKSVMNPWKIGSARQRPLESGSEPDGARQRPVPLRQQPASRGGEPRDGRHGNHHLEQQAILRLSSDRGDLASGDFDPAGGL